LFAHDLHASLALATVGVVAGAAIEAGVRLATGRPPGRYAAALSAVILVVIGMTAAAGLALLARGERPLEFLHVVYAALVFVLLPLGDSLTTKSAARRRAGMRLMMALVALGVVARLFATG
jgi:hypothetical protein